MQKGRGPAILIHKNALSRVLAVAGLAAVIPTVPVRAAADTVPDLRNLSIEDLGEIEVTSVTKRAEPVRQAPTAIYVITGDEILRSGATSVPEMLRLAPNLDVAQASAHTYAISARGFNGTLANKLLVLIDGRTAYTPLYGGVYWDMQAVLRDDIDRIEVISGPGSTLWGANAVNGVINITTRSSADTQGAVLEIGAGNVERRASFRYGGRVNDDLTYRAYGLGFSRRASRTAADVSVRDNWYLPQGGFRADWSRGDDEITLQGDLYRGAEEQPATVDQRIEGENVLARWRHRFSDASNLQIQAFFDRTHRFDTAGYTMRIYDLDVQHSFALGSWNDIVWGGGYRVMHDRMTNVALFQILPETTTLRLGNVFVQDTATISDRVKLTAGVKLEDDPYSGLAVLPSGRLSWQVTDSAMLWAAVSRAVRAPTRYDRGVVQKLTPTLTFLTGSANFTSEKLTAYEVGVRLQPMQSLSFSVSGFYNDYEDLRSIEPSATPTTLPLFFGNGMAGEVYGVEAWANVRLLPWWQMSAGVNVQHQSLHFEPGSSGLGGIEQAGNDVGHTVSVRSSMNLTDTLSFNIDIRAVGSRPKPATPDYAEMNARLAWAASEMLEFSVSGFNLLHARHLEFATQGSSNFISRSFLAEARIRF